MSNYHFTPKKSSRMGGGGIGASMLPPKQSKYPDKFKPGTYVLVEGAEQIEKYPFTQSWAHSREGDKLVIKQGLHEVELTIKEKDNGREYATLIQSGIEKDKEFNVIPFNPNAG